MPLQPFGGERTGGCDRGKTQLRTLLVIVYRQWRLVNYPGGDEERARDHQRVQKLALPTVPAGMMIRLTEPG